MNYINILDCNSTLGTCCKDYGLAKIISIYDSVFTMIQIIVPMVLMVMAAYQLLVLLIDPVDKKKIKYNTLKNKFIAAAIIFFIPTFVNLVIAVVADNTNFEQYGVLACVKEAKSTASTINDNKSGYIPKPSSGKGTTSFLIDPKAFEGKGTDKNPNATEGTYSKNGYTSSSDDSSSSSSVSGAATVETTSDGKKVVEYAKKFLGKKYVYGGSWNGSPNYTPTDCSGFVKGLYAHFGYNIPRVASASLYNSSSALKKVSSSNLQAGDLVLYSGHVAMLTGNGKEIIHASNPSDGIKLTPMYNYPGSNIIAFYRVKGIN